MKKVFLVIVASIFVTSAIAQVKLSDRSLKEVIAQAKTENKQVIVFASATWCGPCKSLIKDVFSQKEVSDYVNANYIVRKYDLDLSDPDSIKLYNVPSYPTLVFVDYDGKEMNRMVGAAKDGKTFLENLKTLSDPSNGVDVMKARFRKESAYTVDYLTYLDKKRMYNEIHESYDFLVKNRSLEELFSSANIEYFKSKPLYLSCPLILFMVKNNDAIIKQIGEKDFSAIITPTVNEYLFNYMLGKTSTPENQRKVLAEVAKYEYFRTPLYNFLSSSIESGANKDLKTTLKYARKYCDGTDAGSRLRIVLLATRYSIWDNTRENKLMVNKFLNWCIKTEDKNEEFNIQKYNRLMEKI